MGHDAVIIQQLQRRSQRMTEAQLRFYLCFSIDRGKTWSRISSGDADYILNNVPPIDKMALRLGEIVTYYKYWLVCRFDLKYCPR